MTALRDARPEDAGPISALLIRAFGGDEEAELVARLRSDGAVQTELVAGEAGAPAGYVMLSALYVAGEGRIIPGAALAPLAVDPDLQGRGIGGQLVRAALARARGAGIAAVFVLGEPGYYGRFGFSADAAGPFEAPFGPPHFMAIALAEGALDVRSGRVAYPPAFGV